MFMTCCPSNMGSEDMVYGKCQQEARSMCKHFDPMTLQ